MQNLGTLLTEATNKTRFLVESDKKTGKKNFFIEGIFLQAEIKNKNGRLYPEQTMDNEVRRYIKESVKNNNAYGELGHPEKPQINLDRVSHLIKSLVKEGTNYIGKAQLMETPLGNIAKGLLEGGGRLGVSSRALGTLKMNHEGVNVVQDDFRLSTAADIVADPSAPDAFVNAILEGNEWIFAPSVGFNEENIYKAKKAIKRARSVSPRRIEEMMIGEYENFLEDLRLYK